jgi:hypothetical protein
MVRLEKEEAAAFPLRKAAWWRRGNGQMGVFLIFFMND